MPRKSDSVPINNENLDRRVKLTASDKVDIKQLYEAGGISQQGLANQYQVSKRSIQFIIHPEKLEENKEQRKARGGSSQYYNREKHTQALREHRDYKKELFNQGKIK